MSEAGKLLLCLSIALAVPVHYVAAAGAGGGGSMPAAVYAAASEAIGMLSDSM